LGWLPGNINVVDVRDVADAHIAAVERGRIGERYIIGGHNYSVKDALVFTASVTGAPTPKFKMPGWILNFLVFLGDIFPSLPLPTNHLRAVHLWQGYNTIKAKKELGFSPRPFEETIHDSLNWFRDHALL
jgi:dihydroflavonol-4-reductase